MKLLLISLLLTTTIAVKSQHAENLFRDYYLKFGLDMGYREMFAKNKGFDGYLFKPLHMAGIGLQYNFYQKGNLNFRIAPQYLYGHFNDEGVRFNLRWTWQSMHYDDVVLISLPVETEYFLKLTNRFYFSPSMGLELMMNHSGFYYQKSVVGVLTISPQAKNSLPVHYGLNCGFSLDYAMRAMLIRVNVKYNYQFGNDLYKATTTANNKGVISTSEQSITGNYAGFGVAFIPKNFFRPRESLYLPGLDSTQIKPKKTHKREKRLFVETGLAIMNRVKFETTGEPILKSKYMISPMAEIGFFLRIRKSLALKIGVGGNLIAFNTNFKMVLPPGFIYSGSLIEHNTDAYYIKNGYLFTLVYKEFPINGKMSLSSEAGLQMNYQVRYGFAYAEGIDVYPENDMPVNLYFFYLSKGRDVNRFLFSLRGAMFFNYNFRPKHTVRVGLGFNYCNTAVATGTFIFPNLPFESMGSASLGINYISIPIGYSFSF